MENSAELNQDLWAVILAAGEGTRLAPLTRLLCGQDRPKQFTAFGGPETLLQRTVERLRPLIPPSRVVVVVAESQEDLARKQLRKYEDVTIALQPANIGTGPGVLLPLSHIRAKSSEARVVVTPSDHEIRDVAAFRRTLVAAAAASEHVPDGVALVGAKAESAAEDLGWIVREPSDDGPDRVVRFVEKPPASVARQLFERGGLWNTLILAGAVDSFWHLGRRYMPTQTARFDEYVELLKASDSEHEVLQKFLRQLYRDMQPAGLSTDILEKAQGLGVVPLANAGWCDCGTPERLVASLEGRPEFDNFLRKIHYALQASDRRKHPDMRAVA